MKTTYLVIGIVILALFIFALITHSIGGTSNSLDAINKAVQDNREEYNRLRTGGYGSTFYEQCRGGALEAVYVRVSCGIDTCWYDFFSQSGQVIEKSGEIGGGTTAKNYIRTYVTNCQLISEQQFIDVTHEPPARAGLGSP